MMKAGLIRLFLLFARLEMGVSSIFIVKIEDVGGKCISKIDSFASQ